MSNDVPGPSESRSGQPALAVESHGWRGHISLRAKGIISLVVLVIYVSIVGVVLMGERERLLSIVQELESVHKSEEQMIRINMSVAQLMLTANESYFSANFDASARNLLLEMGPVLSQLKMLSPSYPSFVRTLQNLGRIESSFQFDPSRRVLGELRTELHGLVLVLEGGKRELSARKAKLLKNYRSSHDAVTLGMLTLVILGIIVIGAVVTIFFTRMTWDIRKVQERALAVVRGYRGRPLPVTRGDEIGGLMEAINSTQMALREREKRLELARHQQFHQEKMAAVGSLASAIAHEINNPISAIGGIAQAMMDHRKEHPECCLARMDVQPEMILEQTRRVGQITRQVFEFSIPRSQEPQLVDLNSLVRSTCSFMRFDKRFRQISLLQDLDPQVPAVFLVADHLTQVLINLLVNAADALEDVSNRRPEIRVMTRSENGRVCMRVQDNGPGMTPEVMSRAFEEYFTTKSSNKGSGLGLFLCQTLVKRSGGVISLQGGSGSGVDVSVCFPVAPEDSLSE